MLKEVNFYNIFGPKFFCFIFSPYLCTRLQKVRALSSAGLEHLPYKQRVGGSNPSAPTKEFRNYSGLFFLFFLRYDYFVSDVNSLFIVGLLLNIKKNALSQEIFHLSSVNFQLFFVSLHSHLRECSYVLWYRRRKRIRNNNIKVLDNQWN